MTNTTAFGYYVHKSWGLRGHVPQILGRRGRQYNYPQNYVIIWQLIMCQIRQVTILAQQASFFSWVESHNLVYKRQPNRPTAPALRRRRGPDQVYGTVCYCVITMELTSAQECTQARTAGNTALLSARLLGTLLSCRDEPSCHDSLGHRPPAMLHIYTIHWAQPQNITLLLMLSMACAG